MFAIIIFDGYKSNLFEDLNNCFSYTDLVSKMVQGYGFFVWHVRGGVVGMWGQGFILLEQQIFERRKIATLIEYF